ncbi:hypothetical protein DBV15_01619, partial [Temnothorax longispinosus]
MTFTTGTHEQITNFLKQPLAFSASFCLSPTRDAPCRKDAETRMTRRTKKEMRNCETRLNAELIEMAYRCHTRDHLPRQGTPSGGIETWHRQSPLVLAAASVVLPKQLRIFRRVTINRRGTILTRRRNCATAGYVISYRNLQTRAKSQRLNRATSDIIQVYVKYRRLKSLSNFDCKLTSELIPV